MSSSVGVEGGLVIGAFRVDPEFPACPAARGSRRAGGRRAPVRGISRMSTRRHPRRDLLRRGFLVQRGDRGLGRGHQLFFHWELSPSQYPSAMPSLRGSDPPSSVRCRGGCGSPAPRRCPHQGSRRMAHVGQLLPDAVGIARLDLHVAVFAEAARRVDHLLRAHAVIDHVGDHPGHRHIPRRLVFARPSRLRA